MHKRGGLEYLKNQASSISSFKICSALSGYLTNLNSIIDVGANVGQFACAINRFYPEASIYSFEPLHPEYLKLCKNMEHAKSFKAYNIALGSNMDNRVFYQNEYSLASSMRPISDTQINNFNNTNKVDEIVIKTDKLDNMLKENSLSPKILLKLDVQGWEKEVLKGGTELISSIDYLLIEMSFESMYEDEPLFDEMYKFLNQEHFELIAPLNTLEGVKKQILQMDVLFKNSKK